MKFAYSALCVLEAFHVHLIHFVCIVLNWKFIRMDILYDYFILIMIMVICSWNKIDHLRPFYEQNSFLIPAIHVGFMNVTLRD